MLQSVASSNFPQHWSVLCDSTDRTLSKLSWHCVRWYRSQPGRSYRHIGPGPSSGCKKGSAAHPADQKIVLKFSMHGNCIPDKDQNTVETTATPPVCNRRLQAEWQDASQLNWRWLMYGSETISRINVTIDLSTAIHCRAAKFHLRP